MKNVKSRDTNDLQIKPVKYVIDITTPIVQYIFNLAFESGQFQIQRKIANVTKLYKGGNKYFLGQIIDRCL